MELYCYSNEELELELARRKNIENQKTIYAVFFESTELLKLTPNSGMIDLIPKTIGKQRYMFEEERLKYNCNIIRSYKEKGFKIVILCPLSQKEYSKAMFYHADEVIIF